MLLTQWLADNKRNPLLQSIFHELFLERNSFPIKNHSGASERAQFIKALTAKPDTLSVVQNHMMEGKDQLLYLVLWYMFVHIHAHIGTEQKFEKANFYYQLLYKFMDLKLCLLPGNGSTRL